MDFKNIIFDMDGTILDSMFIWEDMTTSYMNSIGYPLPDGFMNETYVKSVADAATYCIEKLNIPLTPEDMISGILNNVRGYYRDTLQLKPYTKEFITKMHENGVKMCVATASNRDLAEAALKRNGILHFFEFIITNDEVGKDKTSPDIYLKAAEKMSVGISDVTVFEDAPYCVKTAKNAGFTVIGVHDAHTEPNKAEIMNIADLYIHSFKELL